MISLIEHFQYYNLTLNEEEDAFLLSQSKGIYSRFFQDQQDYPCFSIIINEDESGSKSYRIETSYYIGVDHISRLGKNIQIEPKLNTANSEINVYKMLFEAMSDPENYKHLNGLYEINFDSKPILVKQKSDIITPFLLIQFIQILSVLVKKGLKKSYYRTTENLDSKIKGKILLNKNINVNVLKNNKTKTICEFEVFGFDIPQNRFLKHVLKFVKSLLHKYPEDIRSVLVDLFNYIHPAFATVSDQSYSKYDGKEKNPFYFEYNSLIEIGNLILKIQSFNTTKTDAELRQVPPYWIDMSKLFELYVFKKLRQLFPEKGEVIYHRKFLGGKETDIIIKSKGFECVIDCKYKPRYADVSASLEDYRQLAGYCRMKSIYNILNKPHSDVIKGVIIYSDQNAYEKFSKTELFTNSAYEYVDFYKLGIKLPLNE